MLKVSNDEAMPPAGDRIEITHVPAPAPRDEGPSIAAKAWWVTSRLCTLLVPDAYFSCQGVTDEAVRQARREKWTLCLGMLLASAAFVGVGLGLIPLVLCEDGNNLVEDRESFMLAIDKDNLHCEVLNFFMYATMAVLAAVLVIQFLYSFVLICRRRYEITRDDTRNKVVIMVSCYNEGDRELRKTIDSVVDTSYPDANKVLLVVADGEVTGKGEARSTPEFLAAILGYDADGAVGTYDCTSIGDRTTNRARLYSGTYDDRKGKRLNYLVIVKCGTPEERGSARAGNRGKRDSQLLVTGLLNRFHHGRAPTSLDKAVGGALDALGAPLAEVKYLMAIDADTRVHADSVSHMVYSMNQDEKILALCGETKIDNKAESWVTMIQVFEYYTNHHMKKAFESVFGCVTCLPGCFTMYRLFSNDNRPLLSCDEVYQRYATNKVETLHEKNLFHLGEDRMLTTLLLRAFPGMKLSFVPEATCYTIVPNTFTVLLSQRRRWINSTFHNMLELLRDAKMATVCCVSMKFLVVLDLVATLILPASLIYLFVNMYLTFASGESASTAVLVTLAVTVAAQVLVFLLRARWDYWWWFFAFVVAGVPVFYFVLPLYAFWNMDDFSWGATRMVDDAGGILAPDAGDAAATGGSPLRLKSTASRDVSTAASTETTEDRVAAAPQPAVLTAAATASDGRDLEMGPAQRIPMESPRCEGEVKADDRGSGEGFRYAAAAGGPPGRLESTASRDESTAAATETTDDRDLEMGPAQRTPMESPRCEGEVKADDRGSGEGFRFNIQDLANIERYFFTNEFHSRLTPDEDAKVSERGAPQGDGTRAARRGNLHSSARSLLQQAKDRLASKSRGGREDREDGASSGGNDARSDGSSSTRMLLREANTRLTCR